MLSTVSNPPRTFIQCLRHLGPSLILTAGIVGSGELIVTTTLGARLGLIALWLIILSCVLKVVIQEEIGRYTISSGETALEALNHIPGPRWKVSWAVWAYVAMVLLISVQVAGIVRGVSLALDILSPGVGVFVWGLLMCLLTVALLLRGKYQVIESVSALLVSAFTFTTVTSALLIQWTPYAVTSAEFLEGLMFKLPPKGLAVAFAVFGITGVGTTELLYYPNWCLEKGYARHCGPPTPDETWTARTRGWVRVMQFDALLAMLLYTTATIAFYFLGASILHKLGMVPKGDEMVLTLSRMFTETFGPWAFYLFVSGTFFVLYSSLFVGLASNSLMLLDCLALLGFFPFHDEGRRVHWLRGTVVTMGIVYFGLFAFFEEPVAMVVIGGIAQTAVLPIVAFSVVFLRFRRLDKRLRPSRWIDSLLWVSSSLTLIIALYMVVRPFL